MKHKELIECNFDIKVNTIKPLANHIDSKIFLIEAKTGKYILKEVISDFLNHPENEGELLEYLHNHGISVARLISTKSNEYIFCKDGKQFHLQEFVEGEIISLNTAPDWYLKKTAQLLGQIQSVLKDYKQLPILFDKAFLSKSTVSDMKNSVREAIQQAESEKQTALIAALNERLKHIEKIESFEFDINKLTYANSHGDYYVSQIVSNDQELTVIDWTGACFLPACFEAIMSYTYADPICKTGEINAVRLKLYLSEYMKYAALNDYDLKIMPYFYYYQLCTCNFMPPYDDLPEDYAKINTLCNNLMNWLYVNVDELSDALVTI